MLLSYNEKTSDNVHTNKLQDRWWEHLTDSNKYHLKVMLSPRVMHNLSVFIPITYNSTGWGFRQGCSLSDLCERISKRMKMTSYKSTTIHEYIITGWYLDTRTKAHCNKKMLVLF